jgi:hypothetical protein
MHIKAGAEWADTEAWLGLDEVVSSPENSTVLD